MQKTNNKLRRRCHRCGKRINLKIFWRDSKRWLKCPFCLAETKFISQKLWESRKISH